MTDTQRLKAKLTALRLKGLLPQFDTTLAQAAQQNLNVGATLNRLADLALEHRWHNALHRRWRQSALTEKLPVDQFDFDHQQSRKEQPTRILALGHLDCVSAPSDGILIGNPGTGNTFLAPCSADAACNANSKVLFTTALDRINQLIAAEADHSLGKKRPHYAAPALLGCDELGDLCLGHQGSPLFFQGISPRPQHQSTVITTPLPFAEWGQGFDSTTVSHSDRRPTRAPLGGLDPGRDPLSPQAHLPPGTTAN
jgi:DNA replication protein DnaC